MKTGTVIHGTLRSDDLLRAFANELEAIAADGYARLIGEARSMAAEIEVESFDDGDVIADMLTSLIDALDYHAPDGYYFGAHEGDGSDFGYWPVDDEYQGWLGDVADWVERNPGH